MKAIVFITCWTIYLFGFGFYIFAEVFTDWPVFQVRCILWCSLMELFIAMAVLENIPNRWLADTFLYKQFILIAWFTLIVTAGFVMLNGNGLVQNPYLNLGCFYCANLLFSFIILSTGIKNGIFKEH